MPRSPTPPRLATLAVALIAAGLTAPAAAQTPGGGDARARAQQLFPLFDADDDETITRTEFTAVRETLFGPIDRNDDGVLGRDEFVLRGADPGPTYSAREEQLRTFREHQFAALDADGDGRVTREEYEAFGTAQFDGLDTDGDGRLDAGEFLAFRPGQAGPGGGSPLFSAMDRNADGVITPDEMDAARTDAFNQLDTDGDGVVVMEEAQVAFARSPETPRETVQIDPEVERRFAMLDDDGDGRVTAEEFIAAGRDRFEAADTDDDGRLSPDEFAAVQDDV